MTQSSSASPSTGHWFVAIVLALIVMIVTAALMWRRIDRPAEPSAAALTANNQGIGFLEQFNYRNAVAEFEKVAELAPEWVPGRINLAIALFNTDEPANLQRAADVFARVLEKEPDNPYAHFCLGIIFRHQGRIGEAIPHFEAVTRIDPNDASAWYWLGNVLPEDQEERVLQCFVKAHELNPYLRGPIYGLAMKYRRTDVQKSEALLAEMKNLEEATWANPIDVKYTEMGRYAEAIGRISPSAALRTAPVPLFIKDDALKVKLATSARWAGAADLMGSPDLALLARLRQRFGAVLVTLDFNRDDRPDLLLLGGVLEDGRVRDLLLRNDGNGSFTDVTAGASLAAARTSLGCCVADFDNDGYPDVAITSTQGIHLFRNNQRGRFDDVTKQAGLDAVDALCLGIRFADLDQDGDLDLVIAPHTARTSVAEAITQKAPPLPSIPLAIYLNVGEAPPVQPDKNPPPLTPAFKKLEGLPEHVAQRKRFVNIVVSDFDGDNDLDLLLLGDNEPLHYLTNNRLLRFFPSSTHFNPTPTEKWNGGLVLDVDDDGVFEILLLAAGLRPQLVHYGHGTRTIASPPLAQAQVVDIDLDGDADVVGLSDQKIPVLVHRSGGQLGHAGEALGRDADWPKDLTAVCVADLNADTFPDLAVWSASAGIQLHASRGNGNHALHVAPTGQRRVDNHKMRTNADAIGAVVTVQAGKLWTSLENATLQAGLGQSSQPLLFGLGRHTQADVIRIRWPDNTRQAEFGHATNQVVRIEESNRKPTSCPVLFAWNGTRFGFVTDFLGAGSMGESQPDGTCRPPRGEESVKIEADQLKPRDGRYTLKLAEPMDEVTYLDRLQLVVLDHPPDVRVYPDERLATTTPAPTQELYALREPVFPVAARDHRGREFTQTLRDKDRRMADGFARRSWPGIAEEHWVELDFGDRLARYGPKDRLVLCLAGWTDYTYPETMWAATQAGVALQAPLLERDRDGRWDRIAEIGFPAGMPRMMTYEVTGKLVGPHCVLRLRTNLEVFWDQIYVAPVLESVTTGNRTPETVRANCLEVASATLSPCGNMQEFSPDGRDPTLYDYDRVMSAPVTRLKGKLTRFGDVAELLQQRDDRFVVFGPGDEVTVNFDATQLPQLPPGWTRSFVLRTWGYCKDAGPFTATGDTIEPLPFRGMSRYPYGRNEHYPRDAQHEEYLRRYQTRESR